MNEMRRMWDYIRQLDVYGTANLDTEDEEVTIYRGLRFVNNDGVISIYSTTETDFYKEISDEQYSLFYEMDFEEAVNEIRRRKYIKRIDHINVLLRDEVNAKNNHRRYKHLKTERNNLITKYNEITNDNSRKIKPDTAGVQSEEEQI